MIINTGSRTDIPAFYSEWFMNRIRAGEVLVRNPYDPFRIHRYRLDPEVVDALVFCTKNPEPMGKHLEELKRFRQFWHVTITPYGREVEPGVPDKEQVMDSFWALSRAVGPNAVVWRYDPIFLSEHYSAAYHIEIFRQMAERLRGATYQVVISFIDLYEKTRRNFPQVKQVLREDRVKLAKAFVKIGRENGMSVLSCGEGRELEEFGVDVSGCLTRTVLENAIGLELYPPKLPRARKECDCLLGSDIGAYNTCRHFCKYCYANYDRKAVMDNSRMHDPESPLLIGHVMEGDRVQDVRQESWITGQIRWDF